MVFQGPHTEAWLWGAREGVWGRKNLVQVSTKRILELVEVIWEGGGFQSGGSQV